MNQAVDTTEIANRLISYGVPGWDCPSPQQFPRSGEGISIPPTALESYFSTIKELFQTNKTVAKTYSLKTFEKKTLAFIAPYVLANTTADRKAVRAFLHGLETSPYIDHNVYRPIYRVTKGVSAGPVALGPFTIYHTERDASVLDGAMKGRLATMLIEKAGDYLIHTRVKARDEIIALEISDELFGRFEAAIRFMTGPLSGYDVTVFGSNDLPQNRAIVLSDLTGSSSIGRFSTVSHLDIDDIYFEQSEVGFDKIWLSFADMSNSEFMNKILLAVDWIGQSIAERVPSSAFIKATIALEVLFTPTKGFIASGIVAQLTESIAMLLGTDSVTRFEQEKEAKRLYEIRSRVAHDGSTDVNVTDLLAVQHLARNVVMKLLTSPTFKDIAKFDEIQNALKTLKYSSPAL